MAMTVLTIISSILSALMFALAFYQIIYIVVSLFCKPKRFPDGKPNRFAVLIAARNEANVISQLIESIKKQDYPAELVDVYVVADNCTDNTAEIAKNCGATVFERFNKENIGKGYALNYLLASMKALHPFNYYNGYVVIDADNIIDKSFITEINKVFSAGYKVVTSYRNSKNYAVNWKSSGSALMMLRESLHLNNARMILGTSSTISGTGFVVASEIIERMDGWDKFQLTEDIEFSLECVSVGEKIGYAYDAKLYDEQPTTFSQLWNQRIRWARGYILAYTKYFKALCRGMFKGNLKFSSYDMIMNNIPIVMLGTVCTVLGIAALILGISTSQITPVQTLIAFAIMVGNGYFSGVVFGALIGINAWKEIRCSTWQKIKSFLLFPFIVFVIFVAAVVALFVKVEWKPIKHNSVDSIDSFQDKNK